MQAVAEPQDTPASDPEVAPAGSGVARICQVVPFQASASVTSACATVSWDDPTAVQAVADRQDTPLRPLISALAGLGVTWTCQLVPSHASASVDWVAGLVW